MKEEKPNNKSSITVHQISEGQIIDFKPSLKRRVEGLLSCLLLLALFVATSYLAVAAFAEDDYTLFSMASFLFLLPFAALSTLLYNLSLLNSHRIVVSEYVLAREQPFSFRNKISIPIKEIIRLESDIQAEDKILMIHTADGGSLELVNSGLYVGSGQQKEAKEAVVFIKKIREAIEQHPLYIKDNSARSEESN